METRPEHPWDELPSVPLEELRCDGCGRSLADLRVAVCPDCGRPVGPAGELDEGRMVAAPIPSRSPTVTDVGGAIPVQWDLHCEHCDYNLTGLTSRVCPECGRPFQPRKTWVANRQPSLKKEVHKTLVILACVCVWAMGAYFYPLWLLPVPLWLTAEFVFWYMDRNPFFIRVWMGPLYMAWLVIVVLGLV